MKKLLICLLALSGCAPLVDFTDEELMPLQTSMRPDGTKTWTFYVTPMVRDYFVGVPDDELLARQMGASQACPEGYVVDSTTTEGDMTIYQGQCR